MKKSALRFFLLPALLVAGSVYAQLKGPGGVGQGMTLPNIPVPNAPAAASSTAAPAPEATTPTAEREAAGQLAAAGWLLLLDRRDWGRAWDTTASTFRMSVPIGAWMDGIPKVRDPLGAFVERQPAEKAYKTKLEGRPDGEYVTVIFLARFSGKAEVQEVVTTVLEPDGRWRVTGYSTR